MAARKLSELCSSVATIRPVIHALRAAGIAVEPLFAEVGIRRMDGLSYESPVSSQVIYDFWRLAVERTGDEALGLHAAEFIRRGDFDLYDYVIATSSTLGEAIDRALRYYALIDESSQLALKVEGRSAMLTFSMLNPLRAVIEHVLARFILVGKQIHGRSAPPREVHFTYSQPADISEHVRIFRAPLRFESDTNAVVFPATLLDTPASGADPSLCAFLERQAQQVLEELSQQDRFLNRVRKLIAAELPGGNPSLECIAKSLRVSPRTLRRRLQVKFTSHRRLLEEVRHHLASKYLAEAQTSIEQVATLVGYSDASAFHKAFKRCMGTSPVEYRRQHS